MLKKLIIILYVAVLIVMGTATLVEKANSTDYAHEHIYGAWWFVALWAALAIAGAIYYIMYARRSFHVRSALLHLSLIVILIGAFISFTQGFNGNIHLRQGYPERIMVEESRGKHLTRLLPFALKLDTFAIKTDTTGRIIDYTSRFDIIGPPAPERGSVEQAEVSIGPPTPERGRVEQAEVSMNNIYKYGEYRFYQASYDEDLRGSVLIVNHDFYGITVTYVGYALLFLSFILLISRPGVTGTGSVDPKFGSRRPVPATRWWLAATVVLLTLLWCLDYFVLDGSWREIPILRHPLLAIHVITIILAYALLLVMAIKSLWWLIRKRVTGTGRLDPNSGSTDPVPATQLTVALGLLSAGIFIGAIWANVSWGNYWSWDAKETWALITLMVYAVPAHRRMFPVFRNPKVYHTYILLAFLCILMTYFGVNHFLTGMHSYA